MMVENTLCSFPGCCLAYQRDIQGDRETGCFMRMDASGLFSRRTESEVCSTLRPSILPSITTSIRTALSTPEKNFKLKRAMVLNEWRQFAR